ARPVIRNGLARAELFEHAPFGESQRFWSGLLATQFRIENLHQIKSAVIVNCPKSRYDGTSASQEESTSERGNPLFTLDRSNGRVARRQDNQIGVQRELNDFRRVQGPVLSVLGIT